MGMHGALELVRMMYDRGAIPGIMSIALCVEPIAIKPRTGYFSSNILLKPQHLFQCGLVHVIRTHTVHTQIIHTLTLYTLYLCVCALLSCGVCLRVTCIALNTVLEEYNVQYAQVRREFLNSTTTKSLSRCTKAATDFCDKLLL